MKSMTVHKIDDALLAAIEARAEERGISVNRAMKDLLAGAVGIAQGQSLKAGYARFLGSWTAEEAEAFAKATADLESIDQGDWAP